MATKPKSLVIGRNQIVSRRNGLILTLPTNAVSGNVIQRFRIKGENELVFEQPTATREFALNDAPLADGVESQEDNSLGDVI